MNRKKRRKRRILKMPEISLTPLIDTALTLLIIFIITAPIVKNGIKINLPQGKSKEAGSEQELVISLNKQGEIFFNSYPIQRNKLTQAVKDMLKGKEEAPVFIRADESVSYGKVIQIVDELKQANVKYIAMSTRPSQKL